MHDERMAIGPRYRPGRGGLRAGPARTHGGCGATRRGGRDGVGRPSFRPRREGVWPGRCPPLVLLLLIPLLMSVECAEDSPPGGPAGGVESADGEAAPAPPASAPGSSLPAPPASAPENEAGEAGPEAPSPGPSPGSDETAGEPAATGPPLPPPVQRPQGDPGEAGTASLEARLDDIASVQERILARLDSMAGAGPPAAGGGAEPDPAASAVQSDGLDLEGARDEVRNLGVAIFWSLMVLVVFHFAIRILIWVLETLAERSVRRRLTFKWLIPITRMALWALAAYLVVHTVFRVDAQGILAASAALGVALGFAAQDLLKNVFGGLTVVFDQPFQVGDKIAVGGTYGEVVSIGLRSTRIVTADDDLVTVPNSLVVQEQVANANAGKLNSQVVTDLYLPGRVDERKAKKIAFEAAVTSKYVFLNKPIQVFVEDEFRTTFVTHLKVRAYVLDPRFEFLLRSDITERARDGFRAAGLVAEHDWYPMAGPSGAPVPGDASGP